VLWDESNRVGALLFIKIGLFSMALGVVFFALGLADYFWVLSALTLVVVIASIFYVNRHLRKFQKSLK
jgi:inner membrane protein involved in colicin E2 resistance